MHLSFSAIILELMLGRTFSVEVMSFPAQLELKSKKRPSQS